MNLKKLTIHCSLFGSLLSTILACRPTVVNEDRIVNQPVIVPGQTTLMVGNSKSFYVEAGTGQLPYEWELLSGGGSINSDTGLYTAPGSAGSATIQVTDASGFRGTATITINGTLGFTSATDTKPQLAQGQTHTFAAEGGVPPYTFSVNDGDGSFTDATYTAGATANNEVVRVTDSLGNTADAYVGSMGQVEVWLNASDMNGNQDGNAGWSNNDSVSTWTDVRGVSNAVQSTAGDYPTYKASVAGLNNLPALYFDGNDCLEASVDYNDETAFSIAIVGQVSGVGTQVIWHSDAASGALHKIYTNTTFGASNSNDTTTDNIAALANAAPGYGSFLFTVGGALYFSFNGTTASKAQGAYVPFDASDGTVPVLGSQDSTCDTNSMDGYIAEVLYENYTSDELSAVICHLAYKYGITSTLTCPYEP